jgi:hypothetical protein
VSDPPASTNTSGQPPSGGPIAPVPKPSRTRRTANWIGKVLLWFGIPGLIGTYVWTEVRERIEPDPPLIHWNVRPAPPKTVEVAGRQIRFAVDRANYVGLDAFSYVVPRPIDRIGKAPSEEPTQWKEWAYGMGGVDSPTTHVRVSLQGGSETTVQVAGVSVRIVRRHPLLDGTLLMGPPPGCGGIEPHELRIDLDTSPPRILAEEPEDQDLLFSLRQGEWEVFDIIATADKALYQWQLELDVIAQGRSETITIDNNGKPFVTSGSPDVPRFYWDPYGKQPQWRPFRGVC